MNLFDTLTWAEILVKTTFLGTPTLTVPYNINSNTLNLKDNPLRHKSYGYTKDINTKIQK
jgi:hypothetical protein